MDDHSTEYLTFRRTFFPYYDREAARRTGKRPRFAYYTSADTAYRILHGRELWMRNALAMNDYSEIRYGLSLLAQAWQGGLEKRIQGALEKVQSGLGTDTTSLFDDWAPTILENTYVACLSEHLEGREDVFGRLSMWRGYGLPCGVALILKGDVMFRPVDKLGVVSTPVRYADPADFVAGLSELADSLEGNLDYLQQLGAEQVRYSTLAALRYAVVATKHPGFEEEREWRAIYSPRMHTSTHAIQAIESIRGIPQSIVKLKLQKLADNDTAGLELAGLLDKVIIGPCDHPFVTKQAFERLLEDLGLHDASERVVISQIPLRPLRG